MAICTNNAVPFYIVIDLWRYKILCHSFILFMSLFVVRYFFICCLVFILILNDNFAKIVFFHGK